MWTICTRMEPAEDIEIMRHTWGSRVDPLREPGAPATNSRAIIDACRPWGRRDTFPKVAESSRELIAAVVTRWPELRAGLG
jgi:3-polyprenyl-4-hydroxybenzoate decarboxylase